MQCVLVLVTSEGCEVAVPWSETPRLVTVLVISEHEAGLLTLSAACFGSILFLTNEEVCPCEAWLSSY